LRCVEVQRTDTCRSGKQDLKTDAATWETSSSVDVIIMIMIMMIIIIIIII